ncbi:tRNA lysidine(34) synthetase TilS [Nocardioides sp.]|uniref:tRNA lysidine(34) synthetase TilS n=1 Tax=Nocardioides sp. TaxID=35761 RepID=UPI002BCE1EAF|nr:tRNA lysidine(34) synthetase TilS [Nocardioides sp.]HSX66350.1 tRNA lysidine(34) synthetase TilS [Nocardioides sp.]
MGLHPAVAAVRLAVRRDVPVLDAGNGARWSPHVRDGGCVLVACSGGADSLALLAATVFEFRRVDARVIGAVVDHGLQEGSAEHTARVVEQMAALGVDETASIRVHVDVASSGVEAGAREARYAALGQLATHFGADLVLLGHTLDDQAETVLLGLTRGSGGRSIAGMRRGFHQDGVAFSRPLLGIRRAETEAACRAEGIEFWVDPHNSDPRFLRSRVRHDVLPVLERELGPGIAETLARTADQLRRDMESLDTIASQELGRVRSGEGADLALALPDELVSEPALSARVLRLAALEAGAPADELFAVHVDALQRLVEVGRPDKEIQLPGHLTAYLADGHLRFRRTTSLA